MGRRLATGATVSIERALVLCILVVLLVWLLTHLL